MLRQFFSKSMFRYSQAAKNVFVLPNRFKIQGPAILQAEICINRSTKCSTLAILLRDNINFFSDELLDKLYNHLQIYNLQIDDSFDSILAPITLQYVKAFTRQNATCLASIATCMAFHKIENELLWENVLNKLLQTDNYKYITLDNTLRLLGLMVEHGAYVDHELVKKLQNVIYEQRLYYKSTGKGQIALKILQRLSKLKKQPEQVLKISEAYSQIE